MRVFILEELAVALHNPIPLKDTRRAPSTATTQPSNIRSLMWINFIDEIDLRPALCCLPLSPTTVGQ